MDTPVGMAALVSQLTTGITSSTIFGVVGDVMPFVITMIPIALRTSYSQKSYQTVPVKLKYVSNNVLFM